MENRSSDNLDLQLGEDDVEDGEEDDEELNDVPIRNNSTESNDSNNSSEVYEKKDDSKKRKVVRTNFEFVQKYENENLAKIALVALEPDFAYERNRDTNEGQKGCYHCRYKNCKKSNKTIRERRKKGFYS